ncbi:SMC-Scp complex subunit ScpB [Microbulbifer sp. ANSA003]|uniref:SMC-Scp complex subunit ScpB n=1 Tax=Microbulbifer sp. ANSA003 TaxID=3243360 RepID=UPI0040430DC7
MTIAPELLRKIVEGALLAAGQPLSEEKLLSLLEEEEQPSKTTLRDVLEEIAQSCADRGFELKKVASGWRFQVPEELAPWVNRLWEEKAQRYSRATLETLAIIAYRQPVTRGDIEDIRGVAVSSHIVKTLLERGWIKVVGQRDVPGKPSLYATTREFLDYFNLSTLDDLPTLAEIRDIESLNQILEQEGLPPEPVPEEGESEVDNGALEDSESEQDTEAEPSTEAPAAEHEDIDDALVEALAEEVAAEASGAETETETETESEPGVVAEAVPAETDAEEDPVETAAAEIQWEMEQEDSEDDLELDIDVDLSEESELHSDEESSAESPQAEEESEDSLTATLPPSSMFAEDDTAEEVAEESVEANADVDEDSKEVVQVESTTP